MNRMHNPPHPGETLRVDVLPELKMTVTDAAGALGVSRVALSRVLNGAAGISPEMALRIEKWLGPEHGGRAEIWLRMQSAYDLAQAEKAARSKLKKIKPVEVPKNDESHALAA